jgi:hypothetical protein
MLLYTKPVLVAYVHKPFLLLRWDDLEVYIFYDVPGGE